VPRNKTDDESLIYAARVAGGGGVLRHGKDKKFLGEIQG
jgi:hypothetical protein